MVKIKVDPDQLQASAKKIRQAEKKLSGIRSKVRSIYRNLNEEDLNYKSRASIEVKVRKADSLGKTLEAETIALSKQLDKAAERFRNADQQKSDTIAELTSKFSEAYISGVLPTAAGITGIAGLNSIGHMVGEEISDELYWVGTENTLEILGDLAFKGFKEGMRHLQKIPPSEYQAWGRAINKNWAHNINGGWVGRMDKVGHFLKSPAGKAAVPIVSGLMHFAEDDDPDRVRAAGTAAVQTMIEVGIRSNPVGATIMGANAAVQLCGNLVEGSTKMAGRMYGGEWEEVFYEQAYSLDDNFDRIDLGNITKDLAHVVVDGGTELFKSAGRLFSGKSSLADEINNVSANFSKTGQSLNELWGHVSDFPGGLFDTATDLVTTNLMHGAASVDSVVSVLPVPQEWKNSVHNSCIDTGKALANADQTFGKGLIDFFSSSGMEGITGVIHADAIAR